MNHVEMCPSADVERLGRIALKFRGAFERLKQYWEPLIEERYDLPTELRSRFGIFKYFPWSCCDKTTAIMIRYLHEMGFREVRVVNGTLKTDFTCRHEWIEVGSLIIDITADQFKKVKPRPPAVIVTTDHAWHYGRYESFRHFQYMPRWTQWPAYGEEHRDLLDQFYHLVLALVEADQEGGSARDGGDYLGSAG